MSNYECSDQSQQSFQNATQPLDNVSNNFAFGQYFDASGHLQHPPSFPPTIEDSASLPPSALGLIPQFHRSTTKPHPPALQTANLLADVDVARRSSYFGHQQARETSCEQFHTPTTPAQSPLYLNGSAAESITAFSPSSNTSGEPDLVEGTSPSSGMCQSDGMLQSEAIDKSKKLGSDVAERKKRNSRRMWTHSLEKYIFTPHEIATLGTPHRRTIYSASLEAHIDRLHSQLLGIDLYPVHFNDLQVYRGLNCKIAKSMVAGLQHDFVQVRTRLLEIERAMNNLQEMAAIRANHERIEMQNQSIGSSMASGAGSSPSD